MSVEVMVVAPHPDDAEIGMGGTVAALEKAGLSVVIVDLTNGEPTPHGTVERRMQERDAASAALGLSERRLLNISNRELFDTVENRKKLATIMRELTPQIVFAPFWEDAHPDHWNATQLVESARFYAKFVKSDMDFAPHYPRKVFYYVSSHIKPKLQPAFVTDISETVDAKMASLRAYASQFLENARNTAVLDEIKDAARYWGLQIGVPYGEPFISKEHIRVRSMHQLMDL